MLWRWMDIRRGGYGECPAVRGDSPIRSPILPRRALAYSRGVAAASGPIGGTRSTASASRASPRGDGQHARRAHRGSDQFARNPWPARGSPAWVTSVGHRTPNRGTRGAALRCPRTPVYRVRRRGDGHLRFRGREDRAAKGGAAPLALAKHDHPPSLVMPPVIGNAAHGVRSGPAPGALPGPEVGRPRAHRVGEAG